MSDSLSFNLIDEPWIPCLMIGGRSEELSLRQVLARAPDIQEVIDASPLVTAALHRLLLAILHRCFGPASDDEWAELWDRGSFDMGVVGEYLDKWRHRFDLFAEKQPFYQTPGLSRLAAVPVAKLTHELSAGNNPLLFDHAVDGSPIPFVAGAAARYLLTLQAFAVGGLVSFQNGEQEHRSADSAHLVKGAVILLVGRSLFGTLLFNMVNLDGRSAAPFEFDPQKDAPAWERNEPVRPADRLPDGYLDLLTWQSRRVLLVPELEDREAAVPRVVLMKGYQFPGSADIHTREAMLAFQRRETATAGQDPWPPVGFRPERALWRDSLALLQNVPDQRRTPRTLQELANRKIAPGHLVEIAALGMSSDRAKVLLWRHERLPLPIPYLTGQDLVRELGAALQAAEEGGKGLRTAVWALSEKALFPAGQSDRDRVRTLVDSLGALRPYWAALDTPFRTLMVDLADAWPRHDQDAPLRAWATAIRDAARDAFEAAARSLETSGRGLCAAAEARGQFYARLHATVAPYLPAVQKGESL